MVADLSSGLLCRSDDRSDPYASKSVGDQVQMRNLIQRLLNRFDPFQVADVILRHRLVPSNDTR